MPHSIMDALNYNEKKLQKGKAACIAANGYLLPADRMNFYQKLAGFENLNKRNDRATTKTLHVSLNFDPSEKLSNEELNAIAETYMQKIGFGEQPYLVYRHDDAGHPHIHIVSTTIRADGSRINTHNIGRNQSEKARKEIETSFHLVKAEQQQKQLSAIKPVDAEKVQYGKSETKRSIVNILNAVITKYNYTSLPELNAVLGLFNVMADRGAADGIMYKNGGLLYRIIKDDGTPVGVPIKASELYSKPTWSTLQELFDKNKLTREPYKRRLKDTIEKVLQSLPASMEAFKQMLHKQQVVTVIRRNTEGRMYGITFVDNQNKSVFKGSDIDRSYSINNLQSLMARTGVASSPNISNHQALSTVQHEKETATVAAPSQTAHKKHTLLPDLKPPKNESLLERLITPEQQFGNVPFQLIRKKKRKKKKIN